MNIKMENFNCENNFKKDEVKSLVGILSDMPLYLKESKQQNKKGSKILDPIKTNTYLKSKFKENSWLSKVRIPEEHSCLGTDIDFFKKGIVLEVQFSNYPFLSNNIIRTEKLYKSKTKFNSIEIQLLVIITKGKTIPSSNSSLYYEQAISQINSFVEENIIMMPILVIGFYSNEDTSYGIVTTLEHLFG